MASERPISEIAKVAPLLDAVGQDQSFIRAARRDPATRLLVDDPVDPSVALLWPAPGDVLFLGGREQVRDDALAEVVRLLLSLHSRDSDGKAPPLRLAMPFPSWTAALFATLGHAFAPRGRRSYTLLEPGALPARVEPVLPPGYDIRPMDEALARDAATGADPELTTFWPHLRAFAERGVGFCAIESESGSVASAAWSPFEPVDLVEIAVGTASAHRGRGLSPATANALVRHCLAHGLEPRWSTDFDNVASRRVAAKLGFGNVIEHDWPLHTPFNAERRSIDVPEESTRDYHGRYTANGKTVTIGHDGHALRFFDQLGQTLTLAAESETRFFLREVPIQIDFTRGSDGRMNGFTREQGGQQWRMERLPDV
jgi:GNAT superfamily N-acetyltransferase